jgi:hypothetical protein
MVVSFLVVNGNAGGVVDDWFLAAPQLARQAGHPWGPGRVIISFGPCDCSVAQQEPSRGHVKIRCLEPGCTSTFHEPRNTTDSMSRGVRVRPRTLQSLADSRRSVSRSGDEALLRAEHATVMYIPGPTRCIAAIPQLRRDVWAKDRSRFCLRLCVGDW